MSPDSPVDEKRVRGRVLSGHRSTVEGVLAAADAVAAGWNADATADRSELVGPLRAELDRRGLDDRLLALLVDAVDAAGRALRADPVPAPPYLAVTSRGPVCRATLSDGRLVVAVRAFRVERSTGGAGGGSTAGTGGGPARSASGGPRYVRDGADPEGSLDVTFRTRGN